MKSLSIAAERLFFTSDPHFWHHRAAQMRGFDSPEVMNQALIKNWNAKVTRDDHVVITGDLSFAGSAKTVEVLEQLNGHLHLVLGNHDKALSGVVLSMFDSVHSLVTVKATLPDDQVQRIVCCHFPMLSWDMQHYGAWHVHGHSHGSARYPAPRGKIIDVGVDPQNLAPVSFAELKAQFDLLPTVSGDYHTVKNP